MMSVPVSFGFCTDTNGIGCTGFQAHMLHFVATIEFAQERHLLRSCCIGYSTFLELLLYLKKGYLKNVFSEEKQNLPEL